VHNEFIFPKHQKIHFLASKFREKKAKINNSSPRLNFKKTICEVVEKIFLFPKIEKYAF